MVPRPPLFRESLTSMRVAHQAGATPKSKAVSKERARVKARTRPSAEKSTGCPGPLNRWASHELVQAETSMAAAPPPAASKRHSAASGLIRWAGEAPRAARMENSRARAIARARRRLARLAQPRSSTKDDKPTERKVSVRPL